MANPHRGEVEFKAGEVAYTLRLSINALAEIEDLLGIGVSEIANSLNDPEKVRVGTLRAIVCGGLRERHPGMDLMSAGELIAEIGIPKAMDIIREAFEKAFPEAKESDRPH